MKLSMLCRCVVLVLSLYYSSSAFASPNIVVLGDSLSAGYGLETKQSWVSLLADKLKSENYDYTVINGSVTGATSADGLAQLPTLLTSYKPQILILALGSNDGLRGNPLPAMEKNLSKIIEQSQAAGSKVLLVGFKIPVNYGEKYRLAFEKIFPTLAEKYKLQLVPFLLAGFELDTTYFLKDKLHPNASAQPLILNNVWVYLQPIL